VRLNLKMHPTFVSDALISDALETITVLAGTADGPTAAFGARLLGYLEADRLLLSDHPFWTSPYAFWELPPDLRQDFHQSQLIISKGDANYRRLLGDRHWPFTTSFQAITSYRPAPLLALRALKAEIACGLREEQIAWLNDADPQWLVNGRWGVIQFTRSIVQWSNSQMVE
jgi:hypothetical protein